MSNEGYVDKAIEKGTGQGGWALDPDKVKWNDDEKAVLASLKGAGERLRIRQIMELNGWQSPSPRKGSSRVRNALRRLVRAGLVRHSKQIGDGLYIAVSSAPPMPTPVAISKELAEELAEDPYISEDIKKTDCTFYNACLDQAISGKWKGFACTSCNAYAEADPHQKMMDHLGLACIRKAAEFVEKYGKVHRVRGVKPGADAKRTVKLTVVEDAPIADAFANID